MTLSFSPWLMVVFADKCVGVKANQPFTNPSTRNWRPTGPRRRRSGWERAELLENKKEVAEPAPETRRGIRVPTEPEFEKKNSHILCAEAEIPRFRVGDHHPHAGVAEVALAVEEHDRALGPLENRVLHPTPDVCVAPKPTVRQR